MHFRVIDVHLLLSQARLLGKMNCPQAFVAKAKNTRRFHMLVCGSSKSQTSTEDASNTFLVA